MRGTLLAALLFSTGCLTTAPATRPEAKGPAEMPYRIEKVASAVSADGINDKNAWERAKQLRAELDREGRPAE